MINATTATINGVATTINVAIFTLAAKATGNVPKPKLLGASKFVPKPIMYKAIITTAKITPTKANGKSNSFFFSSLSSL